MYVNISKGHVPFRKSCLPRPVCISITPSTFLLLARIRPSFFDLTVAPMWRTNKPLIGIPISQLQDSGSRSENMLKRDFQTVLISSLIRLVPKTPPSNSQRVKELMTTTLPKHPSHLCLWCFVRPLRRSRAHRSNLVGRSLALVLCTSTQ